MARTGNSNNREEQEYELEALRMIFLDDLIEICNNDNIEFQVKLNNENHGNCLNLTDNCILHFAFSEDYPNSIPTITIESDEMSYAQKERMYNVLELEAKANLGSPMIFNLISLVQDWWHIDNEQEIKKDTEEKLKKETERYKRIDGTPVSVETFMQWKKIFEEEWLSKKKNENMEEMEKRLTGRQIFEKNSMMNISDQMFLEDNEFFDDFNEEKCDEIPEGIDESLFENIDEEIENLSI